jgi:hypothetical protein
MAKGAFEERFEGPIGVEVLAILPYEAHWPVNPKFAEEGPGRVWHSKHRFCIGPAVGSDFDDDGIDLGCTVWDATIIKEASG